MSQCCGGNIGMLSFLLNSMYSSKPCRTCKVFPSFISQNHKHLHCSCTELRGVTCLVHLTMVVSKELTHYSFFPEPDFQREYWDLSRRLSSHKPHGQHLLCKNNGVKLILIKYIKRCYLYLFFLKIKTMFPINPVVSCGMCFEK